MFKKSIALLVSTSMLGACYGFRGPQPVLNPSGVVVTDHENQPRVGPYFQRFAELARAAAGCVAVVNGAGPLQCADGNVTEADKDLLMRRYMRAGFNLIYFDCHQYLAVMAQNQGRSRIARDLIAPVAALITGIISLRNLPDGSDQDLLTGITLATTTTAAGLDIIDQRFLFGSDNIDSVRAMVTRALTVQANEALTGEGLNFETASIQILNNQAICTPSGILRLTRASIQNSTVEPDTEDGEGDGVNSENVLENIKIVPGITGNLQESVTTRTRTTRRGPPVGQGMSSSSVNVPPPR